MSDNIKSFEENSEEVPVDGFGHQFTIGNVEKILEVEPATATVEDQEAMKDEGYNIYAVKFHGPFKGKGVFFGPIKGDTAAYRKKVNADILKALGTAKSRVGLNLKIANIDKEVVMEFEFQKTVQGYINSFRKKISAYIQDEIGQEIIVLNIPNGIFINIKQESRIQNSDEFLGKVDSLQAAFNHVNKKVENFLSEEKLKQYQENVENGKPMSDATDIFMGDSLIIVKGLDKAFWSAESIDTDIKTIVDGVKNKRELAT